MIGSIRIIHRNLVKTDVVTLQFSKENVCKAIIIIK